MQIELETPVGPLTIHIVNGRLVRELRFGHADDDDGISPSETVRVLRPVQAFVAALHDYFSKGLQIQDFEAALDLSDCTAFQLRVYRAAAKLGVGETTTYGALAEAIGCPGGGRAVGQALGKNPFLVVIPCHRVLAHDGALGGFSAGIERKQALLAFESANC